MAAGSIVQTVLGPVDASALGFTLSHEHIVASTGEDTRHYPWAFDWTRTRTQAISALRTAKAGGVDLALVAVSAEFLSPRVAQQGVEHMRTYNPDVLMPAHHDAAMSGHTPMWRATEPIFQAMKDENPKLVTVSRAYREPVCFDTEVNRSKAAGR